MNEINLNNKLEKDKSTKFMKGLRIGVMNIISKDKRLIVLYIGSSKEFVENELLCFQYKKKN